MDKDLIKKFLFLLSLILIIITVVSVMIQSDEGIIAELIKYAVTLGIALILALPLFRKKKNQGIIKEGRGSL